MAKNVFPVVYIRTTEVCGYVKYLLLNFLKNRAKQVWQYVFSYFLQLFYFESFDVLFLGFNSTKN